MTLTTRSGGVPLWCDAPPAGYGPGSRNASQIART